MPESGCECCKHYVKLEEPYRYDALGYYPEGVTVYGFCGKDAGRSFYFYPVYIPRGECKEFSAKRGIKKRVEPQENQLTMEGMP